MSETNEIIRQMMVGRTRRLLDEGYNVTEIANKLNLQESTVRSYVEICKEADKNRKKGD